MVRNWMKLLHKSIGEFIGTFALVFAGCGSIMVADRFPGSLSPEAVPVVFGLVVAAMVYALGHLSGAHINPAVTIGFAISRHFPPKEVLAYCLAQILGGLAAMSLLVAILPPGQVFGMTIPSVEVWQAVVWEVVLTFFLMFVIIAVATDTRAVGTLAGVAIGATVMLGAFVGGPVTGGSMNPARSLAPALIAQDFTSLWIYLVAPVVGAIAAALTYQAIRCGRSEDASVKGCC